MLRTRLFSVKALHLNRTTLDCSGVRAAASSARNAYAFLKQIDQGQLQTCVVDGAVALCMVNSSSTSAWDSLHQEVGHILTEVGMHLLQVTGEAAGRAMQVDEIGEIKASFLDAMHTIILSAVVRGLHAANADEEFEPVPREMKAEIEAL